MNAQGIEYCEMMGDFIEECREADMPPAIPWTEEEMEAYFQAWRERNEDHEDKRYQKRCPGSST